MKRRVTVSIVLCVIVLVMTSAGYALHGYLNTGNHSGLSTLSFAPAAVKKVSDEKDIAVRVYPTGEIMPHNDEEDIHEVRLNNIKRGWIVNRYGGNCRLLFEIKDADMDDFYSFYNDCHYYYAEMIPKDRLRITDITARQGEDPEDPFANGKKPVFLSCCILSEMGRYNYPRTALLKCILINVLFVLIVVVVNVLINRLKRRNI